MHTHDPTSHPSFVVARIITAPGLKRRSNPDDVTLISAALLEVQTTVLLLAFDGRTVARSCNVAFVFNVADAGVRNTDVTDTHDETWV